MSLSFENIKQKFLNNQKIAENYFFMTFLQGAGLIISLLLYPYLIRTLGKEVYGTYVFILSNIHLLAIFVSFGFDLPALKKISLSPNDNKIKSQTVSEVFTAKIILFFVCLGVLFLLYFFVPFVRSNFVLYLVIYSTLLIHILFPVWYFQGVQKMKIVTYVNLSMRILTIPLIFIFVKTPADSLSFALIVSLLPLAGGVFAFFYLQIKENIKIRFVSIANLKPVFIKALPFFWNSAFSTLKTESVTFLIGIFFGMKDVALFDLANKLVVVPRMIIYKINAAIFPNIVQNYNLERIKRIMRYEKVIGIISILVITAGGYWAVLLLGGRDMLMAYPLTVILSFTIYAWLIVGCYLNFVFIPQGKYYLVTKNQLTGLVSFFVFAFVGLLISKNIIVLVLAYTLSEMAKIAYCKYVTKKYQLL